MQTIWIKKILMIVLLNISNIFCKASDSLTVKLFTLKTDLLAVAIPVFFPNEYYFSLTPEKNLGKKISMQIQLTYNYGKENYRIGKTFQIIPQGKYYFNKAGKGLFLGLYVKYEWKRERLFYSTNGFYQYKPHEKLDTEYLRQSIAGGGIAGFQFNFAKHWVGEIILGYGGRKVISENFLVGSKGTTFGKTSNDALLSLNFGYKF